MTDPLHMIPHTTIVAFPEVAEQYKATVESEWREKRPGARLEWREMLNRDALGLFTEGHNGGPAIT